MSIKLSDLKEEDIGRTIFYNPRAGFREAGIITRWNDQYVFVQYEGEMQSKATRPEDLKWA